MHVMTPTEHIERILAREGGYVDHPADRGGPTKYGVTRDTLAQYRRQHVSAEDVQQLTRREAAEIYRYTYLRPFLLVDQPELLAILLDAAVHHGVGTAARMLQGAVGVARDGIVGPVTAAAVNKQRWQPLAAHIIAKRAELYGAIIHRDHSQAAFALGWARRLSEVIQLTWPT